MCNISIINEDKSRYVGTINGISLHQNEIHIAVNNKKTLIKEYDSEQEACEIYRRLHSVFLSGHTVYWIEGEISFDM